MGRLIDVDLLDEEVMHLFISITGNPKQSTVVNECKSTFRRIIDEQPTAYDLEAVVRQLEDAAFPITLFGETVLVLKTDKAIEIIRNGGVK